MGCGASTAVQQTPSYGGNTSVKSENAPGTDTKTKPEVGALSKACEAGSTEDVQQLLDQGADVDEFVLSSDDKTPLMWAAAGGHMGCAEVLLQHGPDLEKASATGRTALHWAVYNGRVECAALLITEGASLDATDNNGWTPLHFAVYNGNKECAALLISKGAKEDVADKTGRTPLSVAADFGNKECVDLLVHHGASVEEALKGGPEEGISDTGKELLEQHASGGGAAADTAEAGGEDLL